MADANLSQQLSSNHNHLQDSFQTVQELLQEGNFTAQNQEKLCSESTNLSDFPCGSFQTSARITSSNDFAQENKIGDVGSSSCCERIKQVVEKKQDFNQESLRGCEDSVIDENGLLDAKKKQLLAELEAGSVFKNRVFVKDSVSCLNMNAGILEGFKGVNDCIKHSLNVEMVDETALIGPVLKLKNCVGSARIAEPNGKRNDNQENNGKKAKRNHGIGNGSRKVLETSEGKKTGTYVCGVWNDGSVKRKYSRKEMEALRFVNVVEQKKIWRNIFSVLGNDVVQEYKALATNSKAQKNNRLNCDHRQNRGRREGPPIFLGEISSKNDDIDLKNKEEDGTGNVDVMDPSCCSNIEAEDTHLVSEEGESGEEYDSDDDYTSIQKPAFLVEGEPDFDSGPPEDGLEYLRRVRWEAAHIPKVKVAKLGHKVDNEQSVYMPQIPDIAKCPDHLLPSEQWENAFLADFLELRQLLSCDEGSSAKISSKLPTMSIVDGESTSSSQLTDSIVFKKFDNIVTDESYSYDPRDDLSLEKLIDQQSLAESDNGKTLTSSENPTPRNVVTDSLCSYPSLTAILSMDSVARVSMLRKRICAAETMDTLSKNDCIWLFSLCAAVDTPLDADTSAALRSLLRKCASLRAAKSELDDEAIMLNILATISGRYFGQSEC